jgi:hypothetical protein
MATKGQMTGMLGVYLVAAELSSLGFIVSPTSRSAAGADLLVTDQHCLRALSVQVKTNKTPIHYWLLGKHAKRIRSDTHFYVFVNLRKDRRHEYLVVPSVHVAAKVKYEKSTTGSEWYTFSRLDRCAEGEGWELFGNPNPQFDVEDHVES